MPALNAPLRPFRADAVAAARAEFTAFLGCRTESPVRGLRNVADILEHGLEPTLPAAPVLNIAA